jgi:fluoroquinolone resistance protein
VILSNARFRETSFEQCKQLGVQWIQLADFVNPSFKECNLGYCNFSGLKLKKTTFFKCGLRDADFSQADLSESDLRETDLLNARFHGTTLLKADFRGARAYLIDPVANKVRGARFSLPEAQGLLTGLGIIVES